MSDSPSSSPSSSSSSPQEEVSYPQLYEQQFNSHLLEEKEAARLSYRTSELLFDSGVELVLFRKNLIHRNISEILNSHHYAQEVVECGEDVDVFLTADIADNLMKIGLATCKIDVGRLAVEWLKEKQSYKSMRLFLLAKLESFTKAHFPSSLTPSPKESSSKAHSPSALTPSSKPKDVVLYGFGRIGRLAARELIYQSGKGHQLRLRGIVTRDKKPEDIIKRAALLSNDSVHGAFKGTVTADVEKSALCINGQYVQMITSQSPEEVDYTKYGINDALIIDNTGAFRNREALKRHLKAKGVSKVLLTAPGKDLPNIVYGVNNDKFDYDKETIFGAASCTTNAIVPVLKVIQNNFKIEKGHIETIHSYTNDQNLLDNYHQKTRRGRSAAINMVITETGAASAVVEVLPELEGLLTASAVRVPTPNASLAILNLNLDRETSIEEMNDLLRTASLKGDLVNQIHYSIDPELVSSDIVGNDRCSVFDSIATNISGDKKSVILYVWYDNEHGYTRQVIRLAKHVCKVRRQMYY